MTSRAVVILEIIPLLLALGALVAILSVYLRRRVISRDSDVVVCGFRPGRHGRWSPSLLRMSATSLQVFPLFGWSLRPAYTWTRRSLDLGDVTTLEDDTSVANAVDGQGRGRRVAASGTTEAGEPMDFDLALGPLPYTALRYWVESAPPAPTWRL